MIWLSGFSLLLLTIRSSSCQLVCMGFCLCHPRTHCQFAHYGYTQPWSPPTTSLQTNEDQLFSLADFHSHRSVANSEAAICLPVNLLSVKSALGNEQQVRNNSHRVTTTCGTWRALKETYDIIYSDSTQLQRLRVAYLFSTNKEEAVSKKLKSK